MLENLKKEIVGDENILNIVNEIETLTSEDGTIKDFQKDFQMKLKNWKKF